MEKKEQEKKSTPKRQNVSDNDMENVSGGFNLAGAVKHGSEAIKCKVVQKAHNGCQWLDHYSLNQSSWKSYDSENAEDQKRVDKAMQKLRNDLS